MTPAARTYLSVDLCKQHPRLGCLVLGHCIKECRAQYHHRAPAKLKATQRHRGTVGVHERTPPVVEDAEAPTLRVVEKVDKGVCSKVR